MTEHSISEIWIRVRRRVWIPMLCALIGALVAGGLSVTKPKQYTASADLLFRDPGLDQKLFGSSFLAPNRDATREAATDLKLVEAEEVARRAARLLGNGLTSDEVKRYVTVSPNGQSDLVRVSATRASKSSATTFANTYADAFIAYRREADQAKVASARKLVQAQLDRMTPSQLSSGRGLALQSRAQQLEILTSLQTGNVELAQRATDPDSASSPRPRLAALIGGVAGFVIGALALWLALRSDRRIRTVAELERIAPTGVLATVPTASELAGVLHSGPFQEPFRMLLARLEYFNVDRDVSVVLATSPSVSEGKSTVIANVAMVAAASQRKTLLIEADLRRPTLAKRFDIDAGLGLVGVLTGRSVMAAATVAVRIEGGVGAETESTLDILAAGAVPPNPSEMLESDGMKALLLEARERYDLVLIDSPPLLVVPDAMPLVAQTDGVVVVARCGQTQRPDLVRLYSDLDNAGGRVLGTIANGADDVKQRYYEYIAPPADRV